jgi:hypothetical protein
MALPMGIPDFNVMANCEHMRASDRVLILVLPISVFSKRLKKSPLTGVMLVITGHFSRICRAAVNSSGACTTPLISTPSAVSAL